MGVMTSSEFFGKEKKKGKKGGGETPADSPSIESAPKESILMKFPLAPVGKSNAAFYIRGVETQVELEDGTIEVKIADTKDFMLAGFEEVSEAVQVEAPVQKTARTIYVLGHPDNIPGAPVEGEYVIGEKSYQILEGVVKVATEQERDEFIKIGFNLVRDYEEEL